MQLSSYSESEALDQAAAAFHQARSIFFITGAGISADSGLSTYRGIGGLYNDADTDDGIPIEEALSGEMFRTRPEITWKYMGQIEASSRGKTFNRAHEIIAKLESAKDRVWVLTQNIDGFHIQAGSKNVIEIHGTMRRLWCTKCNTRIAINGYDEIAIPPCCPACRADMRPDVVLFGEMLPSPAVSEFERQSRDPFDLYVSIGTSSVFPYVVEPMIMAHRMGRTTIEINPAERTNISDFVDCHLQLSAASALQSIAQRIKL